VEHRRFRRVQVLGLVVAEHPTTEGDHSAAAVAAREDHAVAEAVVTLAAIRVLDQQAGVDQQLLAGTVGFAKVLEQVVPAGRGEAEGEVAGDLAGQSAALQVVHRHAPRRMALQRLAVVVGSGLQQLVERDRKSTRLNSSHVKISYAVFCLKKKTNSHYVRLNSILYTC